MCLRDDEFPPSLLYEIQKEPATVAAQAAEIRDLPGLGLVDSKSSKQWFTALYLDLRQMQDELTQRLQNVNCAPISARPLQSQTKLAGGLGPAQQQTIREYVEANLNRDIRIDDLAKLVGLSCFHILRVFKKATGETPYQYLLRRRVERAHDLPQTPALSASEVAAKVGFKDSTRLFAHFTQLRA